jgi:hypothetical protein
VHGGGRGGAGKSDTAELSVGLPKLGRVLGAVQRRLYLSERRVHLLREHFSVGLHHRELAVPLKPSALQHNATRPGAPRLSDTSPVNSEGNGGVGEGVHAAAHRPCAPRRKT